MVVGEQHEALEVLRVGAGIVRQPRKAEIGPQAIEQRERNLLVGILDLDPVGQLVPDIGKVGMGEMARKLLRADAVELCRCLAVEHVRKRDFLLRRLNIQPDRIVALYQFELRAQIGAKQARPGHGGRVHAFAVQPPERAAAAAFGFGPVVMEQQARVGISPGARTRDGQRTVLGK